MNEKHVMDTQSNALIPSVFKYYVSVFYIYNAETITAQLWTRKFGSSTNRSCVFTKNRGGRVRRQQQQQQYHQKKGHVDNGKAGAPKHSAYIYIWFFVVVNVCAV